MVSNKRHAMNKENDMEKQFLDKGFELVEDTARRTINQGDKIMQMPFVKEPLLVIDHKSTKSIAEFKVNKKEMLDKIAHEADLASKRLNKECIPAITFSIFNSQKKYIILDIEDFCDIIWKTIGS